jgi:nucleotide-binding universal stress UspA family protein
MAASPQPRIFVGIDRSIPGLAALRFAVAEARRRGAPLHAVRVQNEFKLLDLREIDAAFADAFGGPPEGVQIHREVLVGRVAEALTRRAHHSTDILIVGTHGRGRWHALWFGSVSRACLRKAHCPVLIVPGPEMAESALHKHRWTPHRRDLWASFEYETPIAGR